MSLEGSNGLVAEYSVIGDRSASQADATSPSRAASSQQTVAATAPSTQNGKGDKNGRTTTEDADLSDAFDKIRTLELLLDCERQKCAKSEAIARTSESVRAGLQEENQMLAERTKKMAAMIKKLNADQAALTAEGSAERSAEVEQLIAQHDQEMKVKSATIASLTRKVRESDERIYELEQEAVARKVTEGGSEAAEGAQRELKRVVKQLKACEARLDELEQEKAVLEGKLRAAARGRLASLSTGVPKRTDSQSSHGSRNNGGGAGSVRAESTDRRSMASFHSTPRQNRSADRNATGATPMRAAPTPRSATLERPNSAVRRPPSEPGLPRYRQATRSSAASKRGTSPLGGARDAPPPTAAMATGRSPLPRRPLARQHTATSTTSATGRGGSRPASATRSAGGDTAMSDDRSTESHAHEGVYHVHSMAHNVRIQQHASAAFMSSGRKLGVSPTPNGVPCMKLTGRRPSPQPVRRVSVHRDANADTFVHPGPLQTTVPQRRQNVAGGVISRARRF